MHPIIGCATDIRATLKAVWSVEPSFMTVAEKESARVALAEARSQLDALTVRVLAASDDVGEQHGLRDAAAWLAVQTRTTRRDASRDLALGRTLERHPGVAAALSSGEVRAEQARVITDAVDALRRMSRRAGGNDAAGARGPVRRPRPAADRQADP